MLKNVLKSYHNLRRAPQFLGHIDKRYAGHSKWQNIRHIKGAKDAQKAITFQKLGKQIKIAVQEGGSGDPTLNLKLEQVVEQAKRSNMPMSTIQNMIKSAQAEKSQSKSYVLEVRGPGGCILLCEIFTDNFHHFKQVFQSTLKKYSSKYADSGALHLFDQKGIILVETPSNEGDILEVATDHAIESGAEDVQLLENNVLEFTCGSSCLKKVTGELEKRGYKITSCSVEYIPNKLTTLNENELEVCSKLYDKIELYPEIVRVSNNIA